MAPIETYVEHADELAQDVVNAWGVNMAAGNAKYFTDEFKALLDLACRHRSARQNADNHRESNVLSERDRLEENTWRQAFAEAYKTLIEEYGTAAPSAIIIGGSAALVTVAKVQTLTKKILEIARAAKPRYAKIHPPQLANDCEMYYTDVEDVLMRMAKSEVIALSASDGDNDKPYDEWPDTSAFFNNHADARNVRVRLLLEGELLLAGMSKAPIGFGTHAASASPRK